MARQRVWGVFGTGGTLSKSWSLTQGVGVIKSEELIRPPSSGRLGAHCVSVAIGFHQSFHIALLVRAALVLLFPFVVLQLFPKTLSLSKFFFSYDRSVDDIKCI